MNSLQRKLDIRRILRTNGRRLIRLVRGDISLKYAFLRSWMVLCRLFKLKEYGKFYFNRVYEDRDPWDYEKSPYEWRKYAAVLLEIPNQHFRNALEVGCSIGVFTRLLAPHVHSLDCIDVSRKAVAAARARCHDLRHIRFFVADFFKFKGNAPYDFVICAELLYFFWEPPSLRTAVRRTLLRLLAKGGLVFVIWGGYRLAQDWDSVLQEEGYLRLKQTRLIDDPFRPYRISVFERL